MRHHPQLKVYWKSQQSTKSYSQYSVKASTITSWNEIQKQVKDKSLGTFKPNQLQIFFATKLTNNHKKELLLILNHKLLMVGHFLSILILYYFFLLKPHLCVDFTILYYSQERGQDAGFIKLYVQNWPSRFYRLDVLPTIQSDGGN